MTSKVVILPGDGIGPEIMGPTIEMLGAVTDTLEFEEHLFGGASIDAHNTPLTEETLAACKQAGAVLLAAVGGPKWDNLEDPASPRPEQGLLKLRSELGVFANVRPARVRPGLEDTSPLRPKTLQGTDLIVVRELTGGIYFGEKTLQNGKAKDTCEYSESEIARIAHVAFQTARRKVTSVDQVNVLDTSVLWRKVVTEVGQGYDIPLEHMLINDAMQQFGFNPARFDVVLTENMFGDILSDEAAAVVGSIGLLPSASLAGDGPGLFEPIHGSAPDIAGSGRANPLAMFLSAALMLRHSFALEEEAAAIETAVDEALSDGLRTADLGGTATTDEASKAVLSCL